ncbi:MULTISPECIES: helix-turn-helix domain-containing protein [Rhodococcus]|uniref:helix-turn-helix domain-containing protein n=1 Tax=Rhodococcus TaxID=1827 RepID=UPI0012E92B78|nr:MULTISPECIES: helix-turn-helix transcriptional regulator [Rhodococcus]MCE4165994.1 helix-turn-helix domain-containing protein [Rhodococcus sp. Ni2]
MTTDLADVIGVNARRLRLETGVTLEQLARALRDRGMPWSTGRVGDMEAGRVNPTMPTILGLADALGEVTGGTVRLVDLVATDGFVELTGGLAVSSAALARALEGGPVRFEGDDRAPWAGVETAQQHEVHETLTDRARANGWPGVAEAKADLRVTTDAELNAVFDAADGAALADKRAAKAFDVEMVELMAAALRLWGHSLADERERLAALEPDANNQRRGQISRDLRAQLSAALESK